MAFRIPAPTVSRAALRAMKSVSTTDGPLSDPARELLRSCQRYLLKTDFEIEALEPISPEELATQVRDRHDRERTVGACVLATMIDVRPSAAQIRLLERYADALGVGHEELRATRNLQAGRIRLFQIDTFRHFFAQRKLVSMVKNEGPVAALREQLRALFDQEDAPKAARYRALLDLPDGTLGREYARFLESNGFSLPGEKGSAPEALLFHDCLHVLAGYDTTPEEEALVLGFTAGGQNVEVIWTMMAVVAQLQLGVRVTDLAPERSCSVDIEALIAAFERGSHLNIDLSDDWDPWLDFEVPVEELRARYRIPPRA